MGSPGLHGNQGLWLVPTWGWGSLSGMSPGAARQPEADRGQDTPRSLGASGTRRRLAWLDPREVPSVWCSSPWFLKGLEGHPLLWPLGPAPSPRQPGPSQDGRKGRRRLQLATPLRGMGLWVCVRVRVRVCACVRVCARVCVCVHVCVLHQLHNRHQALCSGSASDCWQEGWGALVRVLNSGTIGPCFSDCRAHGGGVTVTVTSITGAHCTWGTLQVPACSSLSHSCGAGARRPLRVGEDTGLREAGFSSRAQSRLQSSNSPTLATPEP